MATRASAATRGAAAVLPMPRCHGRNPSARGRRLLEAALATLGFLLAGYLALYQWGAVGHVVDPVFGSQAAAVLGSDVSQLIRRWLLLPDAALGALGYLAEAVLALVGSRRRWRARPWLVVLFGLNVAAMGLAAVAMVLLQAFVVRAWCLPCLLTAGLSLLLLGLAAGEVWASVSYLREVDRRGGRARAWRALWGGS